MGWRRSGWLALVSVVLLCGCGGSKGPFAAPSPVPPTATPPPRQSTTTGCPTTPARKDSRVNATALVISYYNAINRGEYLRAYDYLAAPNAPTPGPGATPTPTLAQWQAGYAHTACVLITFTGAEAGVNSNTAGYAGIGTATLVPISFTAVGDDGTLKQFTGTYAVCYDPAQGISASGYLALDFAHIAQMG